MPALVVALSVLCSAAFARVAGVQSVGQAAPKGLNLLGRALPVYALADVAENFFTALVLYFGADSSLAYGLWATPMAVASLCKLVGLAGVAALCVRGLLHPLLHDR